MSESENIEKTITNINAFFCIYENIKPHKLLHVLHILLFNTWDKIIFSNVYILGELLLVICKYADVFLFSQLLANGLNKIDNPIIILFLVNHFLKSFLTHNNNSILSYVCKKCSLGWDDLINEKLQMLDITTIDKFDKWKIIQYSIVGIPTFINILPVVIKSCIFFFELFFVNLFLCYNQYYNEVIIVDVGIVLVVCLIRLKYFNLSPHIDTVNENFGQLVDLMDERYTNIEYLKSANVFIKYCNHEVFLDKFSNLINNSKILYFKELFFNILNNSVSTIIYGSIFIIGLFNDNLNINVYLFLYAISLLIDPLEIYITSITVNGYQFSNMCGFYDFLHLKNNYQEYFQEKGEAVVEKYYGNKILPSDVESVNESTIVADIGKTIDSIELKNVCKKIKEKVILNNISFHLKSGTKLGIVGESGSGKTTITRLLLKMIHPSSGDIYFNGINSKDLSFETIRDNIIYIGQEPKLFDLSLKYNIMMEMNTSHSLSDDELYELVKKVGLNVEKERLGEDIGVYGNKFSGGQKQKINILRGLLKKASVIILDEPTSALDVNSEHQVTEYIYDLCKDKIIITIAHKLNTIKNVDYILVMEKGEIVEEGSHETLIEKNKIYKQMVDKFYQQR